MSKLTSSNAATTAKLSIAQLTALVMEMSDKVENLNIRLACVEQAEQGQDATIHSSLQRLDAIEASVANLQESAALPEVIEQPAPAPQETQAPMPSKQTNSLDFSDVSTEDLRKMSGLILAELKRRAKGESKSAVARAPKATTADREADKAAYKSKKEEYASRTFGVMCVPTGKVLKRRFADEAEALTAAAELSAQMKRPYSVYVIEAA